MNLFGKAAAAIAERALDYLDQTARRGNDLSVKERVTAMMTGRTFGAPTQDSPGVPWPVDPSWAGFEPRTWNYEPGYNLSLTPRQYQPNPFYVLHELARANDIVQACIRYRIDSAKARSWEFVVYDDEEIPDSTRQELAAMAKDSVEWFKIPDRYSGQNWAQWLTALLYEVLVTDAPAVFVHPSLGGGVHSFRLIDGQTIQVLLDETGAPPAPPMPAYNQIIRGRVRAAMTRDELLYRPMNPRTDSPYGRSPLEMVMLHATIGVRRWTRTLSHFTEGTTPDTWIQLPEGTDPDQAQRWAEVLNATNQGSDPERRKIRPLPPGAVPTQVNEMVWSKDLDEFIVRSICFAFQVNPLYMVAQMNRATAEVAEGIQTDAGLAPLSEYISTVVDECNFRRLTAAGADPNLAKLIKHTFTEDKTAVSAQRAQVLQIYLNEGLMSREQVATEILGLEESPERQALPLGPLVPATEHEAGVELEPLPDLDEVVAELGAWGKVAKRHGGASARAQGFVCRLIEPEAADEIRKALAATSTPEAVAEVVAVAKRRQREAIERKPAFRRREAAIERAAAAYLESKKAEALTLAAGMKAGRN